MEILNRPYKEDTPLNTVSRIEKILHALQIDINKVHWDSMINGLYSVRIETDSDKGVWGQNGKGRDKDFSLASAYAEFIERIQNNMVLLSMPLWNFFLENIRKTTGYYFSSDEKLVSVEDLPLFPNEIMADLFLINDNDENIRFAWDNYFQNLKINNIDKIITVPFIDSESGEIQHIPLNLLFDTVGSTGMASGNTIDEAIFQSFCEIFERYSTAYIYYNRIVPPNIEKSYLMNFKEEYEIIQQIEAYGYKVIIKDFSCGKRIPAVASLIIDEKKNKYRLNVGADTSFKIALSRTLTEILQGIGSVSTLEENMLNIPTEEYEYFLNDDKDSIRKRNIELDKLAVNGNGQFTYSLFCDNYSYEFDPNTFNTKNSYKEEVKRLLELFKSLNSRVYIRNISFLGFPTVYIYATNKVSTFARKKYNENIGHIDYLADMSYQKMETTLFPFASFLEEYDIEAFFLNLYQTKDRTFIGKMKMQNILRLNFSEDHFWSCIPLSFFLSLHAFKKKNFVYALEYWRQFSDIMKVGEVEFYRNIEQYIIQILNKEPVSVPNEIIEEMSDERIFNLIPLPNCPDCVDCDLNDVCSTRKNINLSIRLIKKMERNGIAQLTSLY
ncbi:YcaO-type kinase domain-containing protein [Porphyromonadaceae bacterium KH3R12]|nr:YcaO-type kinase domain-containing protein [Porphyromonadaceae bacterium KH3R12]